MKRIVLLFQLLIIANWVQAQGEVNFNNNNSALTKISIAQSVGGGATTLMSGPANSYYFALFYSTTATTVLGSTAAVMPTLGGIGNYVLSDDNWIYVTTIANSATPGRISGSATQPIPNLPIGTPAQFVILGWSANIGRNLAALQSFFAGESSPGNAVIGESNVSGTLLVGDNFSYLVPNLFGGNTELIHGFTLGPVAVPEPTTIALGVLGGLAMLSLRRKQA